MISIQTNYASLVAQNNLNTNMMFMQNTIEQLTSGYRINHSGDDAAGLAVANGYASNIAELTQGVLNANDATAQLQIADGGLNNISTMLDRLQTLATESASSTFTGNRANINVEYQKLVADISRQAADIGLSANGALNVSNNVFIGGGSNNTNSQVNIDLSGTQNQVDANGLGLLNTSVLGGGTELTGPGSPPATQPRLDAPGATFLNNASETFTFNLIQNNAASTVTAVVAGSATAGISQAAVLSSLNSQLATYGITASVDSNGLLNFGGSTPFTVSATTTDTTDEVALTTSTATNNGVYSLAGLGTYVPGTAETLTFQNGQGTATVNLTAGEAASAQTAIAAINTQTASLGIYAVLNSSGLGISFQSINNFTAATSLTAGTGVFGTNYGAQTGANGVVAPTTASSATGNAEAAITAINQAILQLGDVQSRVGAGENILNYATSLANSQITNDTGAESAIRDANVAAEAANLSQAQVLEQSSIAAMAQANAAPQALLKLLQ
jgi:flagellin